MIHYAQRPLTRTRGESRAGVSKLRCMIPEEGTSLTDSSPPSPPPPTPPTTCTQTATPWTRYLTLHRCWYDYIYISFSFSIILGNFSTTLPKNHQLFNVLF